MNGRRALTLLAMAALVGASTTAVVVTAMTSPGCGPATDPLFKSAAYSPVGDQLTAVEYPPLVAAGGEPASTSVLAATGLASVMLPANLAPQVVVHFGVNQEAVVVYYAAGPLLPQATVVDLVRAHGMEFSRQPAGAGSAAAVLSAVGDRAVQLKVGPYDAAIVHADPIGSDDLRAYELHWSDGTSDFMVYGNVPATDLIAAGRSLYCG
jgi:hypothetical protein